MGRACKRGLIRGGLISRGACKKGIYQWGGL